MGWKNVTFMWAMVLWGFPRINLTTPAYGDTCTVQQTRHIKKQCRFNVGSASQCVGLAGCCPLYRHIWLLVDTRCGSVLGWGCASVADDGPTLHQHGFKVICPGPVLGHCLHRWPNIETALATVVQHWAAVVLIWCCLVVDTNMSWNCDKHFIMWIKAKLRHKNKSKKF